MSEKIRLVLSGYGKVGQLVLKAAVADPEVNVVAVIEKKDHPLVGSRQGGVLVTADPSEIRKAQVLVEFSTPDAVMEHVFWVRENGVAMLVATTGLNNEQKAELKEAAKKIPIVLTSNVTLGMNILFVLIPKMAKVLFGAGWTGAIVEIHREGKKDAPSGTALTLTEGIFDSTGKKIPAISIRAGNIVGIHEITLIGPSGEMLEIIHRVQSREDFALAAISLAKMMPGLNAGLYDISDLIVKELA